MIDRRPKSIALSALVLLIAIAFLIIGAARSYKVYEPNMQDFGIEVFETASEGQLINIATFGGVKREHGKLISTIEPGAAPTGRRACPT